MTTPKPIDFSQVEALRKHMLLTVNDICELLGVTRMTYYSWLKGTKLKKKNAEKVQQLLCDLVAVAKKYGWPTFEATQGSQAYRRSQIDQLLSALRR
jgi:transcriptional regulator with XRE-family HTH domain